MIQTAIGLSVLSVLLSFGATRWPIVGRAAVACVAGVGVCLLADLLG